MLCNAGRAAAVLREERLDALLASTLQNVFYLSGFWSEHLLTVPRWTQTFALAVQGEFATPSLVTSIGDAAAVVGAGCDTDQTSFFGSLARSRAADAQLNAVERRVVELAEESEGRDALQVLSAALERRGLTTGALGYEPSGIRSAVLEGLRARFPNLALRPAGGVFHRVRAVKTEEETRRLHAAVALTEAAIRAAMAMARPGVSEADMTGEFDKTIIEGGGRPLFTYIYFGRRGALGHHPSRDVALRPGEIVRIDGGCLLDGYCSDIARNLAVGEPDKRLRRLHAAAVAAQNAALDAVRPGARAADICRVGVEAMRGAGLPEYHRPYIGHGVGLEIYETPMLSPSDAAVIEEGMVLDVEIPYFEIGSAGLQTEDTVLVTERGPRMLTSMPRELAVMPWP